MECAPTGPCADASHASIQVQRISRKFSFRFGRRIFSAAVGNFSFQMPGGRKLEGSFKAKVHNPAEPIICE
jgi:hypothetical protein